MRRGRQSGRMEDMLWTNGPALRGCFRHHVFGYHSAEAANEKCWPLKLGMVSKMLLCAVIIMRYFIQVEGSFTSSNWGRGLKVNDIWMKNDDYISRRLDCVHDVLYVFYVPPTRTPSFLLNGMSVDLNYIPTCLCWLNAVQRVPGHWMLNWKCCPWRVCHDGTVCRWRI